MYAGAAINSCFLVLLNVLALACAFFLPPWFSVFLVYLSLPCLCYHIFNVAGFEGGHYHGVFNIAVGVFLFQICLYSVIYWKSGLTFGGQQVEVRFLDALYFSITTWSTTGYGDFSPPPRVRLITSSESLLGIFSMGIYIAIVSNWISKRTEERVSIMEHNPKIIEAARREDGLLKVERKNDDA